jgi:DNA-3-methyladenine glycosylase
MERQNLIQSELEKLSAESAAQRLIGSELISITSEGTCSGIIVETEAYDMNDPASHSFNGITLRNAVMFGPSGIAYVYFTYGMHYCMNVVVGRSGVGAAVLIRAMEPLSGMPLMSKRRGRGNIAELLSGPAKLCQALAINKELNGHNLEMPPLKLKLNPQLPDSEIIWTKRIGISAKRDQNRKWRACLKTSTFLSLPL